MSFVPVHNFTADFESVDGLEAVTLTDRAGNMTALTKVLRRAIKRKEVSASFGGYLSGDTTFHLSTAEYANEPGPGWTITTATRGVFTILEVSLETLSARWKCVVRDLRIAYGLDRTVDVCRVTNERTAEGAWRAGENLYVTEFQAVARLQTILGERRVENDRTIFPEEGVCIFESPKELDATYRIKAGDQIWKILRVGKKDRIDVLMEAEVIKTPWPLS